MGRTYDYPPEGDQGTKYLFVEIANIRAAVPKNSVDTDIRRAAWKDKWRKSNEKTSSSESGLHFGH